MWVLFGWPATLASLIVSMIGIVRGRPSWLVAGAILSSGFAFYLYGWPLPVFKALGLALPLLHLAGALAVSRHKAWAASLLLVPHVAVNIYLAASVLSQNT